MQGSPSKTVSTIFDPLSWLVVCSDCKQFETGTGDSADRYTPTLIGHDLATVSITAVGAGYATSMLLGNSLSILFGLTCAFQHLLGRSMSVATTTMAIWFSLGIFF